MEFWNLNQHLMDFRFGNTKCKTNEFVFIDAWKIWKISQNQNGISLEMYLEKKDATKFEPTYSDSKRMFDF
jgi:aminopeptidase N